MDKFCFGVIKELVIRRENRVGIKSRIFFKCKDYINVISDRSLKKKWKF